MKSSRGGLVVERLLHKKCHSATVDQIPLGTMTKTPQKSYNFITCNLYHVFSIPKSCVQMHKDN